MISRGSGERESEGEGETLTGRSEQAAPDPWPVSSVKAEQTARHSGPLHRVHASKMEPERKLLDPANL